MIKIRPMLEKDKKAVEHICIVTAPPDFVCDEKKRERTLLLYNRYYTRIVKHSFVAADENDNAVGYILCAPDYRKYKKEYKSVEIKQLFKLGISCGFWGLGEIKSMKPYYKRFPAHMHIDILPEYQRQNIGHRLVDALANHLKEINVPAVMLCVGINNKQGISFYEKYGFSRISSNGGGIIYALYL